MPHDGKKYNILEYLVQVVGVAAQMPLIYDKGSRDWYFSTGERAGLSQTFESIRCQLAI